MPSNVKAATSNEHRRESSKRIPLQSQAHSPIVKSPPEAAAAAIETIKSDNNIIVSIEALQLLPSIKFIYYETHRTAPALKPLQFKQPH
ncbi:hypothetical protein [Glaciimonas sp. PCH181]|uniref:hypothetical protein n=1 Tax=Glaciimonas sp. PCH181 TaxID=2133943 RepID=UPI000D4D5C58|nr:hypothetical protein [Glaciimonas sp. PCH181]PUA16485.1 hypothetical protein C7W93_20905 [Glaciimonas sp. PCH181]